MPSEQVLRKRELYVARVLGGLSRPNQLLLERFFLSRSSLSVLSRYNYCRVLGELNAFLKGKRWVNVSRRDLEAFIAGLNGRMSPRTLVLYKSHLKTFFRWLAGECGRENPAEWIRISSNEYGPKVAREMLLTQEEFEAMLRAADSARDKALLMVMWESGARLSEIISLRIGDVEIDANLARISVRGKTGHRVIPLISSLPYLQTWLEAHPRREDPSAPLWVSFRRGNFGEPLRETGVQKLLETIAKRAGIKKRVFPHLFRHTRATQLAPRLRESVLKELFGWRQNSRMATIYLHLSGADVEKAIRELHGLKAEEQKPEDKFKPKTCPRCQTQNHYDARYCMKCSLILDERLAAESVINPEAKVKLMTEIEQKIEALNEALKTYEALIDFITNRKPELLKQLGIS